MRRGLVCPGCGLKTIDLKEYESMVVLDRDKALMQFCCPVCGVHLSLLATLPEDLQLSVARRLGDIEPRATMPPQPLLMEDAQTGKASALSADSRPSIVYYSSSLG